MLAQAANITPISASCCSGALRSVQVSSHAPSKAAHTAETCTAAPPSGRPNASAAITPRPAICAIARSMAYAALLAAALRVLACEPEWGALAQELGGKLVDVSVATSALQDRARCAFTDPTGSTRSTG